MSSNSAVNIGECFEYADVCKLPFKPGSYDVVTTSYTLRNFTNLPQALEEMVVQLAFDEIQRP